MFTEMSREHRQWGRVMPLPSCRRCTARAGRSTCYSTATP